MNESRPGLPGENNQDKLQSDQEATRTANAVIDLLREMELFGNHTPKGANPVAFPLQVLSEAQYTAGMKDYGTGYEKSLGERLAPYKKSLKKVEMAYEIIAYPLLEEIRDYGLETRALIRDAENHPNERTDEYPHRAPIALNDAELKILGRITHDRGLPFNPEKRVYQYTDLIRRRNALEDQVKRSPAYQAARDRAAGLGMARERDEIEDEIRKRLDTRRTDVPETPQPSLSKPTKPRT